MTSHFIFPSLVFAIALASVSAEASIVVQQLKTDQGYIVLKTSGDDTLTQGTVLDAPQGGQPCKLKIYYVKGAWAGATIKECPAARGFAVGQEISLAAGEESPEPPKADDRADRDRDNDRDRDTDSRDRRGRDETSNNEDAGKAKYHHLGVQAYYSTATTVNEKFSFSGDPGTGTKVTLASDGSYASTGALGLGVHYTFIKRYPKPSKELHFGGMAGFNYELPRKLNQYMDNSTGNVTDLTDLTLKLSYLEANLMAEYNGFYGFLGPNLSFIIVDNGSTDTTTQLGQNLANVNYSGALGMQIGAGYSFGTLGVEALYRTINGSVTSAVVGIDGKSDQERLWGFMLRVRADFSI